MPYQDTIIGLILLLVILGYAVMNRLDPPQQEAVLAEVSAVVLDIETSLNTAEKHGLSAQTPLAQLIHDAPKTAMVDHNDAPWLLPDLSLPKDAPPDQQPALGGCPTQKDNWVALRTDHIALTDIPDRWVNPVERICLDRNGAQGPNREGVDVIWLAVSRQSKPHVTLIPTGA